MTRGVRGGIGGFERGKRVEHGGERGGGMGQWATMGWNRR